MCSLRPASLRPVRKGENILVTPDGADTTPASHPVTGVSDYRAAAAGGVDAEGATGQGNEGTQVKVTTNTRRRKIIRKSIKSGDNGGDSEGNVMSRSSQPQRLMWVTPGRGGGVS